jgi:hypothetical protein
MRPELDPPRAPLSHRYSINEDHGGNTGVHAPACRLRLVACGRAGADEAEVDRLGGGCERSARNFNGDRDDIGSSAGLDEAGGVAWVGEACVDRFLVLRISDGLEGGKELTSKMMRICSAASGVRGSWFHLRVSAGCAADVRNPKSNSRHPDRPIFAKVLHHSRLDCLDTKRERHPALSACLPPSRLVKNLLDQ